MLLNELTAIRKGPPRPQDAIPPIPATASAFDMTSEDDIGDALTVLAENGEAISMYAAGSRDAILGRILSVDPELPHFVLELNEGATLPPGKIIFVTWLRTAKLQFQLAQPEWRAQPGQPHLIPLDFPETCAVLNRRSTQREETPLGANFMASFVVGGVPYELPVHDFSLGGIGLRVARRDAKGLLKGRKLQDVRLELEPGVVFVVELEIRLTRPFRSFLLGEQLHIGCMFVNQTQEVALAIAGLLERASLAPRRR